jgi:hypothetical protein
MAVLWLCGIGGRGTSSDNVVAAGSLVVFDEACYGPSFDTVNAARECVIEFGADQMEGIWWTARFDATPMLWGCRPNCSRSIKPMIGRIQERP